MNCYEMNNFVSNNHVFMVHNFSKLHRLTVSRSLVSKFRVSKLEFCGHKHRKSGDGSRSSQSFWFRPWTIRVVASLIKMKTVF